MADYQKITDHQSEAESRLLFQFRKNSNVKDLITISGERTQGIEDVLFDIYSKRFLENAEGFLLDWIGTMSGLPRPVTGEAATDDDKYRILIYAWIAAKTSHSTRPDIVNILQILKADFIYIRDLYPAGVIISYSGITLLTVEELKNIIIKATAPISLDITRSSVTPFGFKGNPRARGFGVGQLGG